MGLPVLHWEMKLKEAILTKAAEIHDTQCSYGAQFADGKVDAGSCPGKWFNTL
jgi:hypothetical protein